MRSMHNPEKRNHTPHYPDGHFFRDRVFSLNSTLVPIIPIIPKREVDIYKEIFALCIHGNRNCLKAPLVALF